MYVLNKYKQKDKGVWDNFGTERPSHFSNWAIEQNMVYSHNFVLTSTPIFFLNHKGFLKLG